MINEGRLLDTFLEYIQIDSETGREKAMCDRLVADLKELGCIVTTDEAGKKADSDGYNIYATLPGDENLEPLAFSSHMDTVSPGKGIRPVVQDGVIRSSGDTILGGDDKGGVAAIVEAMRTVVEKKLPHRTIEGIFTICEEGGLRGAKNLDYSRIRSKQAVVLDGGGDVGKIVTSAPGQLKLTATIIGRAAHAGVAPEKGVSAIQVAAHGVAQMNLLRIDEETTANIGTFMAQGATNIVSPQVQLIGECRSRNTEKLRAQGDHMVGCLKKACDTFGAQLEYQLDTIYLSYQVAEDDPLVIEIQKACSSLGITPSLVASGGGSDANIMSHNGIKAVVLSTGMDKVHTTNEQLTLQNLNDTALLALTLMKA